MLVKCVLSKTNVAAALAVCFLSSFVAAASEGRPADERTNVVFILADDLGWSDTTLYGTTTFYRTPNIQRLAASGMTFTNAYAASPLCSPTRASILTGQNPARTGITAPVCHLPEIRLEPLAPNNGPVGAKCVPVQSVTRLVTDHQTLAESLRDAGYVTAHFGKWHLGAEPYSPLEHGFSTDVPHWHGPGPAGSYVAPWRFPAFTEKTANEHIEDRMGDEAVAFLEAHQDKPFFLNYWQFSVHAPFDAKPLVMARYHRLVDPASPQRCATYAAMVEALDDNVGKILDTLDRLKLTNKTAVIFFSDNGGNMYSDVYGERPTSNAPLRGGKATIYEGGVRVPCVVRWPGVTIPGTRSEALIQSTDFYPTILELLNVKRPDLQVFDGDSIVPALRNEAFPDRPLFTYFPHAPRVPARLPPSVAVRDGDWKLIRIFHHGENGAHRYELYNLADDVSEIFNVAAEQPDVVRRLDALIDRFLQNTSAVLPEPNDDYDPASALLQVYGLRGGENCHLSVSNGILTVECVDNDPHFNVSLPRPIEAQTLSVHLLCRSSVRGNGQLFWREQGSRLPFNRERSEVFAVKKSDEFQDVTITLSPKKAINALRIDPLPGRGTFEIQSIEIRDSDNMPIFERRFEEEEGN